MDRMKPPKPEGERAKQMGLSAEPKPPQESEGETSDSLKVKADRLAKEADEKSAAKHPDSTANLSVENGEMAKIKIPDKDRLVKVLREELAQGQRVRLEGAIGTMVEKALLKLSEALAIKLNARTHHGGLGGRHGYGQDFKNSVFEIRKEPLFPLSINKEEYENRPPNFVCDDLKIWWDHYIGNKMTANRRIDWQEIQPIVDRCQKSLL